MAEITIKDVETTARLAKLEFSGEEKSKFAEQFSKIIGFVEQISQLNTENVPPTTHAVEKKNVIRQDVVGVSMPVSELEKIAPKSLDGSILVPKIIER